MRRKETIEKALVLAEKELDKKKNQKDYAADVMAVMCLRWVLGREVF